MIYFKSECRIIIIINIIMFKEFVKYLTNVILFGHFLAPKQLPRVTDQVIMAIVSEVIFKTSHMFQEVAFSYIV